MILTGKPSLHALRFIAKKLGVPAREVGVVGDDPAVEIIMARRGGATAFGVTTGVMTFEDWARHPVQIKQAGFNDALVDLGDLKDRVLDSPHSGLDVCSR